MERAVQTDSQMARAEASRGRYLSDAKKLYVREVLLRQQAFSLREFLGSPRYTRILKEKYSLARTERLRFNAEIKIVHMPSNQRMIPWLSFYTCPAQHGCCVLLYV